MKYRIRIYGDPVLRKQAIRIDDVNGEVQDLADAMVEMMHEAQGIGLAAQQIGETCSICVLDIPVKADSTPSGEPLNPGIVMPLILINPEIITASSKTNAYEEGCLSFPEITASIIRPDEVDLRYMDRKRQTREIHVKGLLARAVQHEVDHLNGILFIDRMSHIKRVTLSGNLKRMKKETEQSL